MSIKPKIKFSLIIVVVTALVFSMSTSMSNNVFAAGNPQNGFGKAASECASSKTCPTPSGPGSMGQHASSFSEPREGIGNVAKDFGCSVSDLGKLLSHNEPCS